MRNRKKGLALLLLVVMLTGLLAVPASAAGAPYIRQVEAGKWTSWAVTSTGDLYGWGKCSTAELFNGKTGSNVPVKLMSGVKSVSASSVEVQPLFEVRKYDDYGYIAYGAEPGTVLTIIKENGDLYTWGDNTCFQLGKGYYEAVQESYEPYFVMGDVVKAATSDHACAAITENGDLYFWGHNMARPYGNGNGGDKLYDTPTLILSDVKDVELSDENIMALKNDGSVWMMGTNLFGVLARDEGLDAMLVDEMTKVMDGCTDIATGSRFAMAVKNDGTLYGWGYNGFTILGVELDDMEYTGTPIVIATNVKSVDAGNHNAYFIKNDNSLWSLGNNLRGERGIGNDVGYEDPEGGVPFAYPYYPTQVDANVHSVTVGANHVLYLKNDGTMWGCGGPEDNGEGGARLGRGDVWGETVSFVDDGQTFTSHSAYQWHATQCGLSYGSFAGMFGPVQEEVELVAGFSDVPADAYYRDAVQWAVDRGITSGTGGTTFSPDRNCTRAEILTFLWRAMGSPAPKGDASFADVAANAYYADAAAWAAGEGIVPGDRLDPDASCTRAMAVEFLWRAGGCQAIATDTGFTDVPISASYSTAVEWAVIYGITSGTSESTFSPDMVCTRGQIMTFLYRAFAM